MNRKWILAGSGALFGAGCSRAPPPRDVEALLRSSPASDSAASK